MWLGALARAVTVRWLASPRWWVRGLVCSSGIAAAAGGQDTRLGYAPASWARESRVEERFRSLVVADSISALHRPLAARPHPAGSPGSREVIAYLRRTLEGFGLDVATHDYQVWLSEPVHVRVSMTAPTARVLSVHEPPMASDPTSSYAELSGGYIAYSASGDVTAEPVYVNYGLPGDYAELAKLGVSVRGRIAVARYGRSHRAVKVHTAQEQGARALILFSDPADDGALRGSTWPDGYWRGADMLQRGNAKLSWYFHGDPLTPSVAALADAPRLHPDSAPTLPRIPVVALAWNAAKPLLDALDGPSAPQGFRGALGTQARIGPGKARVRVDVRMHDSLRTITNVVASLRGETQPDRIVMLGGHHDAWTFGGVDPGTGAAALLELGRVLGALARQGTRPARTMALAFWDAEEFGLIGSTEYVEQFKQRLQEQLVLYVNIDMYMRGRFDPGGAASLTEFVGQVAGDVPAETGTVLDAWSARERPTGATPSVLCTPPRRCSPTLKLLGSGADFVAFQDHIGVPTLSIEFIGENGYGFGTYHTNYDARAYVERVADPGFAQGVIMVRVLGTLALRMANADVLPIRPLFLASRLAQAMVNVEASLEERGRTYVIENVRQLRSRLVSASMHAEVVESQIERKLLEGKLSPASLRALNDSLARLEQQLLDDEASPERAWYRHVVHGWDIYSLYDGQAFPGLGDAMRRDDSPRIAAELGRIERAIRRFDAGIGAMSLLLPD